MDKSITRYRNQNIVIINREFFGDLISMTAVSRLCQATSARTVDYNEGCLLVTSMMHPAVRSMGSIFLEKTIAAFPYINEVSVVSDWARWDTYSTAMWVHKDA
jgi:hypothetical protein